jgi:adenylate cyclase
MEIERKFLVRDAAWRSTAGPPARIRQGYLARGEAASVRIRIRDGTSGFLTVKSVGGGRSRAEFEYQVPVADAEALMALCGPDVLEKQRFLVQRDRLVWEVDVFAGRHEGLVLAEIELEREDQPVDLPDWVGREVTEDPRYRNGALAHDGLPAD